MWCDYVLSDNRNLKKDYECRLVRTFDNGGLVLVVGIYIGCKLNEKYKRA